MQRLSREALVHGHRWLVPAAVALAVVGAAALAVRLEGGGSGAAAVR